MTPLTTALANLSCHTGEEFTPLRVLTKGGAWVAGHPYRVVEDSHLLLSDRDMNIKACIALDEIAGWVWEED